MTALSSLKRGATFSLCFGCACGLDGRKRLFFQAILLLESGLCSGACAIGIRCLFAVVNQRVIAVILDGGLTERDRETVVVGARGLVVAIAAALGLPPAHTGRRETLGAYAVQTVVMVTAY